MVLVAYAWPVRPAAALRESVLCLPVWASTLDTKRPPAPPDLGVREIATFRGKAETAIQFFVFGKFRTGQFFFANPQIRLVSFLDLGIARTVVECVVVVECV